MEHWPAIIQEAAQNPLGAMSLVALLLCTIALGFFSREHVAVRLVVFLVLFAGAGGFGFSILKASRVDPSIRLQNAELENHLAQCSAGVGAACNSAASRIGDGRPPPIDFERSAALYERACELGDGRGCRNYARRLKLGKGVTPDLERARAFYARACELGYSKACDELANL